MFSGQLGTRLCRWRGQRFGDNESSVLTAWLHSGWLTAVTAWIGSFMASVLITWEVHLSLNVNFVCVVKFAVLGARSGKN